MKKDYYEILGISKTATEAEIKSAYRNLAKKYHPDLNPDNPEAELKFKEINEAYEVLMNADKRAAYDRFGHSAFEGGQGGFDGGFGGFQATDLSDLFEDVFSSFMGGGRRYDPSAPRKGSDMRYDISISLQEAFTGVTKSITVPTHVKCSKCKGKGSSDGSEPETCQACNGRGKVRRQQGFFTVETPCPTCGGKGKTVKNPCHKCSGSGIEATNKTFDVKIPAGVDDGTRMRLAGEGDIGINGGENGDLYVFISVENSKVFYRKGNDLYCEEPVSIITATLGGEIDAPSIDKEPVKVKVPKGTQHGTRLKVKGRGMPVLNGGGKRGDMYVDILVQIPTSVNSKQEELLREFEKEGANHTPGISEFLKKVKDFLGG